MDNHIPTPPAAPESPRLLPWEDPAVGGFDGLVRTIVLFVTRPDDAFSRLADAGIGRPFAYAVITSWIELVVVFAYWAVFQLPLFAFGLPSLDEELAEAAIGAGLIFAIGAGIFLLIPVFVAVGLAIHACILHLMLLIVGEGRRGFDTTVRVICYAHTADLANIIPLCGGIISLVWFVALQIVGLARAHQCSYGKAALAVFLPLLLCCSCLSLGLALMGAFSMSGLFE
jgi:hypothetical protein